MAASPAGRGGARAMAMACRRCIRRGADEDASAWAGRRQMPRIERASRVATVVFFFFLHVEYTMFSCVNGVRPNKSSSSPSMKGHTITRITRITRRPKQASAARAFVRVLIVFVAVGCEVG